MVRKLQPRDRFDYEDEAQPTEAVANEGSRFRFKNLASRLAEVNVDVVHRVRRTEGHEAAESSKEVTHEDLYQRSFFCVELDRLRELNSTATFKKLYWELAPLVQTLPELIHHLDVVLQLLEAGLRDAQNLSRLAVLELMSVIARDLQNEFYPYFHRCFGCLADIIDPMQMEFTAKVFETMGYIIKYSTKQLVEDISTMRVYYGPLLGHSKPFVRQFAAETFSALIRKLKPKRLRAHVQHVIKALAAACAQAEELAGESDTPSYEQLRLTKRQQDVIEGVSLLSFHVSKGIKGCLHTVGCHFVHHLMETQEIRQQLIDQLEAVLPEADNAKVAYRKLPMEIVEQLSLLEARSIKVANLVVCDVLDRCIFHIQPHNGAELLAVICSHAAPAISALQWLNRIVDAPAAVQSACLAASLSYVRSLAVAVSTRQGRLLQNEKVMQAMADNLTQFTSELCKALPSVPQSLNVTELIEASIDLFAKLWRQLRGVPCWMKALSKNIQLLLELNHNHALSGFPLEALARSFFTTVSRNDVRTYLLQPMLATSLGLQDVLPVQTWLHVVCQVQYACADPRPSLEQLVAQVLQARGCEAEVEAISDNSMVSIDTQTAQSILSSLLPILGANVETTDRDTVTTLALGLRILFWVTKSTALTGIKKDLRTAVLQALKTHLETLSAAVSSSAEASLLLCSTIQATQAIVAVPAQRELFAKVVGTTPIQFFSDLYSSMKASLLGSLQAGESSAMSQLFALLLCGLFVKEQECHNAEFAAQNGAQFVASMAGLLRSPSHWIRCVTLCLATLYDPLTYRPVTSEHDSQSDVYNGACNAVELCLRLVSTHAGLRTERKVSLYTSKLDVMVRSQRLPAEYLSMIANLAVGLLYVKYSEVWKFASESFVWCAESAGDSEEQVHQVLLQQIQTVNQTLPIAIASEQAAEQPDEKALPSAILDCLLHLELTHESIPASVRGHYLMPFNSPVVSGDGLVDWDARTDAHTVYEQTFDILRRCPAVVLQRSKFMVPMFLGFLHYQYYAVFPDDPDKFELNLETFIGSGDVCNPVSHDNYSTSNFSTKILKKRLECFLKVFAAVHNPRQLHLQNLLFKIFYCLLTKPEPTIAKLCLDCILLYKPKYLVPYKESVKRLLDDGKLREELIVFNLGTEQGNVLLEHRNDLVPLVIRLLFGRFVSSPSKSKNAREAAFGRRAAILSFMSSLPPEELREFVYVMVRGLIAPLCRDHVKAKAGASGKVVDRPGASFISAEDALMLIEGMTPADVELVLPSRQIGLLSLLGDVVKHLGHRLDDFIGLYLKLIMNILTYWEIGDGEAGKAADVEADVEGSDDDEADNEDEAQAQAHISEALSKKHRTRIRGLALRRITEVVEMYHAALDLTPYIRVAWTTLGAHIRRLPITITTNKKPPALLMLLDMVASTPDTVHLLQDDPAVIPSVLNCVAAGKDDSVSALALQPVLAIIDQLLQHDEGSLLLPHMQLLIESFATRFGASNFQEEDTIGALSSRLESARFLKEEFRILCGICETLLPQTTVDTKLVATLATLLLPFMKPSYRQQEEAKVHVFNIYSALVGQLQGQHVQRHIPFLSRLLGPTERSVSYNVVNPMQRTALSRAFVAACSRPGLAKRLVAVAATIESLNAFDEHAVEERDFEKCMPVLNQLAGAVGSEKTQRGWNSLVKDSVDVALATSVVYQCLYLLHDSELGIRIAATAALQQLVTWVAPDSGSSQQQQEWLQVVESIMMPVVRRGLRARNDAIRRCYIQVLAEVVKRLGGLSSKMFHGDLRVLLREDAESDFFVNVTHIQLHRRMRAMGRLKRTLLPGGGDDEAEGDQERPNSIELSQGSLSQVLVPLCWSPILSEEYDKKEQQSYLQECVALLGVVCRRLAWSHYHRTIRAVLSRLEKVSVDHERILLSTLVAVVEGFPLDLTHSDDEAQGAEHPNEEEKKAEDDGEQEEVAEGEGEDPDVEAARRAAATSSGAATSLGQQHSSAQLVQVITRSLVPWIRKFLLKDSTDKRGMKQKVVRPDVCLALLKLLMKLPSHTFDIHLRPLVMTVVNTLTSRDVNIRDTARQTLGRMCVAIGPTHLKVVLEEVRDQLTSGFMLFVRSYTLHSILLTLSAHYSPDAAAPTLPVDAVDDVTAEDIVLPEFDGCIDVINEIVLEDLFGAAAADREAEGADRSLIREAKGTKSYDSLELCARMILFRPTYAVVTPDSPASSSSIHALLAPYLARLKGCNEGKALGRLNEILQRIVVGLTANPSVITEELLLYVHATINPYFQHAEQARKKRLSALGHAKVEDVDAEEGDEEAIPGYLNEESDDDDEVKPLYAKTTDDSEDVSKFKPVSWVLDADTVAGQRSAYELKKKQRDELVKVEDGQNAPKLTGHARHDRKRKLGITGLFADPAVHAAVKFGLELLHTHLKKAKLDRENPQLRGMVDPFIGLLAKTLNMSSSAEITSLSLRCLGVLLPWNLESLARFAKPITQRVLKIMLRGGALVNMNNDTVQGCLRALTSLLQWSEGRPAASMPLDQKRIRGLLSILTANVLEVDHQSATFQLVKAIVRTKIMCPEMYDLIDKLHSLTVSSYRKGIRDAAAQVLLFFMLEYPLGEKRLAVHIKQVIANCSFEHEEGRLAGIGVCKSLCESLPEPVLNEHAMAFILTLALRLVNDSSSRCRQLIAECLSSIFVRVSADVFTTVVDYVLRWFGTSIVSSATLGVVDDQWANGAQQIMLNRMAAQVGALLVQSRPDLMKRENRVTLLVAACASTMATSLSRSLADKRLAGAAGRQELVDFNAPQNMNIDLSTEAGMAATLSESTELWMPLYFVLCLLHRMYEQLPGSVEAAMTNLIATPIGDALSSAVAFTNEADHHKHVMFAVFDCLLYPHVWVRIAASRCAAGYLRRRNVSNLRAGQRSDAFSLLIQENALFDIARRSCRQIEQATFSSTANFSLLDVSVEINTWVIRAMYAHPELCTTRATSKQRGADGEEHEDEEDEDQEVEVEQEEEEEEEEEKGEERGEEKGSVVNGANWAMHRLSYIAISTKRSKVKRAVFAVFMNLIQQEAGELLDRNLRHMLAPLVRERANSTAPLDEDETALLRQPLSEFATEVMDALERAVDTQAFLEALNAVQSQLQAKREQRKRTAAAEAITDPHAHAKRKMAKNLKKREAVKRKNQAHQQARGAGGKRARSG